jgi:hypothetical protein
MVQEEEEEKGHNLLVVVVVVVEASREGARTRTNCAATRMTCAGC